MSDPRRPVAQIASSHESDATSRGDAAETSPSNLLLSVRNLSVAYASDAGPVVAVDDVDLDLHRGEFLVDRGRVRLR